MKNPLELLIARHDEIEREYVRVYNLIQSTTKGRQKLYEKFEAEKKKDLKIITNLLGDYKETIAFLRKINQIEY